MLPVVKQLIFRSVAECARLFAMFTVFSQKRTSWVNKVKLLGECMCEESSMKKKFPAMAEVGMKSRPAGPGRDEFSRSDSSSYPSSDLVFVPPT